MNSKIIFLFIYYTLFNLNEILAGEISDYRLCGDEKCEKPVAIGLTVLSYVAIEPHMLSFKPNMKFEIYSRPAGSNTNLIGVKINGKRGYVPVTHIKEIKILKSKVNFLVPTEKNNQHDVIIPSTDDFDLNLKEKNIFTQENKDIVDDNDGDEKTKNFDNNYTILSSKAEKSTKIKTLQESYNNIQNMTILSRKSNEIDNMTETFTFVDSVHKNNLESETKENIINVNVPQGVMADKPSPDKVAQPYEVIDGTTIYHAQDGTENIVENANVEEDKNIKKEEEEEVDIIIENENENSLEIDLQQESLQQSTTELSETHINQESLKQKTTVLENNLLSNKKDEQIDLSQEVSQEKNIQNIVSEKDNNEIDLSSDQTKSTASKNANENSNELNLLQEVTIEENSTLDRDLLSQENNTPVDLFQETIKHKETSENVLLPEKDSNKINMPEETNSDNKLLSQENVNLIDISQKTLKQKTIILENDLLPEKNSNHINTENMLSSQDENKNEKIVAEIVVSERDDNKADLIQNSPFIQKELVDSTLKAENLLDKTTDVPTITESVTLEINLEPTEQTKASEGISTSSSLDNSLLIHEEHIDTNSVNVEHFSEIKSELPISTESITLETNLEPTEQTKTSEDISTSSTLDDSLLIHEELIDTNSVNVEHLSDKNYELPVSTESLESEINQDKVVTTESYFWSNTLNIFDTTEATTTAPYSEERTTDPYSEETNAILDDSEKIESEIEKNDIFTEQELTDDNQNGFFDSILQYFNFRNLGEIDSKTEFSENIDSSFTNFLNSPEFEDGVCSTQIAHNQNFIYGIIIYLGITSITVLIFTLGYYYIEKLRQDGTLVKRINELEKALLQNTEERNILRNELELARGEEAPADLIEKLTNELSDTNRSKMELEEQIVYLERELETTTEAGLELNKMLAELLNNSNSGSTNVENSLELLQKQLNEQQVILAEKTVENEHLTNDLSKSKAKTTELTSELNSLVNNLTKIQEDSILKEQNLQLQIDQLKEQNTQLINEKLIEHTNLTKELNQLRENVQELEHNLSVRDNEIIILKDNLKGTDSKEILNVSHIKAELEAVISEKKKLNELFEVEQAQKNDCQSQIVRLNDEIVELRNSLQSMEKDKIEIQTRLEVLSNYFKEKENQLQKELAKHEELWLQKEGQTNSATERIKHLQEEIQNYKSQNEMLKNEIVDQEVNLKSQISVLEKKNHENWLQLRQCERRLEDSKQECSQLRNRLTLAEKSAEDKAQFRVLSPLNTNGELGSSPIHPSLPSPILYPMPPPPTGLPFIPPPLPTPNAGLPFIPPPPDVMFPGDRRPPPLGRMSSPPPPPTRAYSPPYDDDRVSPSQISSPILPPSSRSRGYKNAYNDVDYRGHRSPPLPPPPSTVLSQQQRTISPNEPNTASNWDERQSFRTIEQRALNRKITNTNENV